MLPRKLHTLYPRSRAILPGLIPIPTNAHQLFTIHPKNSKNENDKHVHIYRLLWLVCYNALQLYSVEGLYWFGDWKLSIFIGKIKQVKMFIDLWPILFVPGSLCSERPRPGSAQCPGCLGWRPPIKNLRCDWPRLGSRAGERGEVCVPSVALFPTVISKHQETLTTTTEHSSLAHNITRLVTNWNRGFIQIHHSCF